MKVLGGTNGECSRSVVSGVVRGDLKDTGLSIKNREPLLGSGLMELIPKLQLPHDIAIAAGFLLIFISYPLGQGITVFLCLSKSVWACG